MSRTRKTVCSCTELHGLRAVTDMMGTKRTTNEQAMMIRDVTRSKWVGHISLLERRCFITTLRMKRWRNLLSLFDNHALLTERFLATTVRAGVKLPSCRYSQRFARCGENSIHHRASVCSMAAISLVCNRTTVPSPTAGQILAAILSLFGTTCALNRYRH